MTDLFLVWGPESSGNHLAARLLFEAGCLGSYEHSQRWFRHPLPEPPDQPLVWVCSQPHSHNWVDINEMAGRVFTAGYRPRVVVPMREFEAMVSAQVATNHVKTRAESQENIRRAYSRVFSAIGRWSIDYYILSYDSLISRTLTVVSCLLEWAGLDADSVDITDRVEFRDENAKHYRRR